MTQGGPMLTGLNNTATRETQITLSGGTGGFFGLGVTTASPAHSPLSPPWAGITVGAFDPKATGLYSIGRGTGVYAVGMDGVGVFASSVSTTAVHGIANIAGLPLTFTPAGQVQGVIPAGVFGESDNGNGVQGTSNDRSGTRVTAGVFGEHTADGMGVVATSAQGIGIRGTTRGSGVGAIAILGDYQGDSRDGVAVVALGGHGMRPGLRRPFTLNQ